jgi:hypothetical protein
MSDLFCYSAGMMKKEISIEMDGLRVVGNMEQASADMSVGITSPFRWLKQCAHVMSLARMTRPFEGQKGIRRAQEMLAELYGLGCFLRDHMEPLQAAYALSREEIKRAAHSLRLTDFSEDKAALKARLKSGEIDNVQYQKERQVLQSRKTNFKKEYNRIEDDFFEKHFPNEISISSREQVLQILDQPDLLFYGTTKPKENR